jgi:7-cyano-7-deazaguanine synthase in queuosine biosynthesis
MKLLDVDFDLPDSPVGVLCSGGADSSLILYLLMKYSNQPIHILTMANRRKHFTNAIVASKVIDWCTKKTLNNNIVHTVKYVDKQTDDQLQQLTVQYLKVFRTIYIGDTCYPPDEINNKFSEQTDDYFTLLEDRKPNKDRPTKAGPIYVPFTNYDKRKIAQLYRHLDIMELANITRSCETFEDIGTKHCGNCWWCKEREWAFSC